MSEIQEWKDWRIDKQLGAGSFGKVYRAVREDDYGNTYEAALKIIHIPQNEEEYETMRKDMMDDDSVTTYYKSLIEDLVKEIVTMSRLRGNSTIVSYMDHEVIPHKDSFGWDIYINMELLTPLHKYIRENPLTEVDVVSLGVDICKALVVCDKFHIIHRDIKPENIFVSDTGRFKLGDFGIARQLDKTTSSLSKKGTYMYMAPEVERQQTYNKTVDMYSLGLVLYWFMNGYRHPFFPPADKPIRPSDRQESLVKRLRGDEIPAPAMASERFARIILKACAFDPKDRYADAAAMQEELEDLRDEMRAAQKAAPGEAEHTEILTVPLREGTGTNGTGAAPGTGSGTGGVFGTGNGTANDTGGGLSGTGGGTGNGTGSPPGYVPQQQEPSEPSISPPPKQESGTRPDYSAPAPAPAPVKQKRRSKKRSSSPHVSASLS